MIKRIVSEDKFLFASFTVKTKDGVEARMAQYGNYVSGGVNNRVGNIPSTKYWGRVKGDFIFLFHAQKFRRKTEQQIIIPGKRAKNQEVKKVSTKIRDSYWEVNVYKFPLSRIISAKQNIRNFNVTISA